MLKMNSNVDLKKFAEEYGFRYCRKTSIYPRRYHKSFEGKNWNFMQIYIDTKEVHTGSLDDDGVSDFLYDLIKKDIIVKEELKYCQMKFINNEKRELSYV